MFLCFAAAISTVPGMRGSCLNRLYFVRWNLVQPFLESEQQSGLTAEAGVEPGCEPGRRLQEGVHVIACHDLKFVAPFAITGRPGSRAVHERHPRRTSDPAPGVPARPFFRPFAVPDCPFGGNPAAPAKSSTLALREAVKSPASDGEGWSGCRVEPGTYLHANLLAGMPGLASIQFFNNVITTAASVTPMLGYHERPRRMAAGSRGVRGLVLFHRVDRAGDKYPGAGNSADNPARN